MIDINNMNIFNPHEHTKEDLPDEKGIYIIVSKDLDCLPVNMRQLNYSFIGESPVIYVGISGKGLRRRDYKNHFNGSARISTLRKSLGVILGLEKEKLIGSKYKFIKSDEQKLTNWMKQNLTLHYMILEEPSIYEKDLIIELAPPLNLTYNKDEKNSVFRRKLKEMRNAK